MKIHKLKIELTVIIMFHLTIVAISEELEIFRTRAPGEDGWRHGTDSFKIPPSLCNQGGMKCEQFGAKTERPCFCSCPCDNATLLFHNNEWRCLNNSHVRMLLGYPNSSEHILFENETMDNPLRLAKDGDNKRITLSDLERCRVEVAISWLIGCNGSEPYSHNIRVFWVSTYSDEKYSPHYHLRAIESANSNAMLLKGRIIKLGIICYNFQYRWLLFKYVGSLKCLAPSPSKGTGAAGNSVKALILLCCCHTFLFRLIL